MFAAYVSLRGIALGPRPSGCWPSLAPVLPVKLACQLDQLLVGKGKVVRYRTAATALSSLLGGHTESSLFWGFRCAWMGDLADENWAWSLVGARDVC